jgi:hypothetical protein
LTSACPHAWRRSLPSHQVSTVVQEGCSGVKNGKLLALAATGFDALVTVDKNIAYQHNTSSLPVAELVLDTASNDLPHLLTLVPALEAALANLKPGSYVLLKADV